MEDESVSEPTASALNAAKRPELPVVVQGWLNDIDRALRDVFTSQSDEDEAFDSAAYALDALREYLVAGCAV